MFDLSIMNKTVEFYQQAGNFFDLFKFHNTVEISKCLTAQMHQDMQQNNYKMFTINDQEALEEQFSRYANFPVCRDVQSTVYELVVFIKQNIDAFMNIYISLEDTKSEHTLINLFCSQLFGQQEMLDDISEPLLLLSGRTASQKIKSISEILYQYDAVHKQFPEKKVYLRLIHLADNSVSVQIFTEKPEQMIIDSAEEAIQDYCAEITQLSEMNQTLGEALTAVQQYVGEGDLGKAIPILSMCDTFLTAMSQAVQQSYPFSLKQKQ